MGELASDQAPASREAPYVETVLKDGLARGDRALSGVAPVLAHLLASNGHSLVSDAIVARLSGMLMDISRQLLTTDGGSPDMPDEALLDQLSDHLGGDSAVLSHCYAIAMEGLLTERFEHRSSIDPILTPLLQELIASDQPAVAELAMAALAAQSRFMQSQRRMALPLSELPAELFHAVLKRWQSFMKRIGQPPSGEVIQSIKQSFDEGASRVGVLARLVSSMRGGAAAALELDHAGLALFVSGLSALTRQPRELAVLACHEQQAARLALSLRAAGLDPPAIERQFAAIEPLERLPHGLGDLSPQRALALLRHSNASAAG
ncbi:hypothetical protein [Erythrobacter sp. JK5]|uniref:hypothetical protein n=1 Tax=Erythrobacter sp. JK5 TaxID=2829500 RepID=UPI001BA7B29C|nr:hypothetical protein [Erythrobacter sp. JK5]QUL38647.1 hypothetical protein KDC96_04460 [Erythrobacter sp. JK5]